MNNEFLRAAASYYGMNPDTTATDWQNDGGAMLFTFSIHATEDDMSGILQRMKVMREEEAQSERDEPEINFAGRELMRMEYDSMSKSERSNYGSFHVYCAQRIAGVSPATSTADASLNRKVEHINAPEDSEPVSMDAVWIDEVDATDAQRQFAVDMCRKRGLLVQWAMLTEEQKAHVAARSGGLPG